VERTRISPDYERQHSRIARMRGSGMELTDDVLYAWAIGDPQPGVVLAGPAGAAGPATRRFHRLAIGLSADSQAGCQ
jgi:hypothetical protein